MKLYATITSERASKGQGGNTLDIEIMGRGKDVIARIKVSEPYPYEYNMDIFPVIYPYPDKRIGSSCLKLDVKGHGYKLTRKEKDKKDIFNRLETTNQDVIDEYRRVKGKSQKGEHKHNDEDCEFSDCVICGTTKRRCELDDNLQCEECK